MHYSENRQLEPGDIARGRSLPKWRNPNPKGGLTEEMAQEILDNRPDVSGGFNFRPYGPLMRRLAAEAGCSVTTVQRIWRRQAWTHLRRNDEPPEVREGDLAGGDQ